MIIYISHKKPVFRVRFCPKLPPDTENWSAEAFLDIITKKQKKSLKNIFSQNFKKQFYEFFENLVNFPQPKYSKEKILRKNIFQRIFLFFSYND